MSFITPWCPANKLEWYRVIILSAHISGIAKWAVSLPGIGVNLNSRESNKIYFFASISTLFIAAFLLSNLFCAKYWYMSLKYELFKYPACISFIVKGKCLPFNTFFLIIYKILSISVCFGKNCCIMFLVSIRSFNSIGSWKYDLLGLS